MPPCTQRPEATINRLGIDLGGTKIEGVVLSENGDEVFRKRIATEAEQGYAHIVDNIHALYTALCDRIDGADHTIRMGTPGALSAKTGLLKNSNTVCLNGKPLKDDTEERFGRPIGMQNDANCFAMAEALYGAGKGHNMVFGVIMGTGCGGGIVCKGEVITGHQAIAGEWGHASIDPNGPACYCGTRGCVETFISGGGLERMYTDWYHKERSLADIVADYRRGDEEAQPFMANFFRHFGRAMANLINILDPDIVVLGGGVSNIDELYTEGVREVQARVFSDTLETQIVQHALGDSSGVIGAALIGV